MKLDLNLLNRRRTDEARRAPSHLLGGRVRTSTIVLIVAFLAAWWLYAAYGPPSHSQPESPPTQVVPPGFVPDPEYTWVPRTRVEPPAPPVTRTPTTTRTTTPTTTPPPVTTTTTTPTPPGLPCLLPPPFCPASTSPTPPTNPTPSNPPLGPSPAPGPTPPGR